MASLTRALELCWHPVCTLEELRASFPHPFPVTLLGRRLAVAEINGQVVAMTDRCPHRSTRLSIGWVEPGGLRCAYHGWRYGADGVCNEIPSMPDAPIPGRACIERFETDLAYGLVWVRLDPTARTVIPPHPSWGDQAMRVFNGPPYTWPTSAPRRVENFVDLAHFAWVHDGSLGRRDQPVPPVPEVRRIGGALAFDYRPPDMDVAATALFGYSDYRMTMPLTVDIAFTLDTGARRRLWMTASPIDTASCRSFWSVGRDDDLAGDDGPHLAFQQLILHEDEPVVCNQDPPEMVLDTGFELSVRTDRVSIEYRRWLKELAGAATIGADEVMRCLEAAGNESADKEIVRQP